MHRLFVTAFLPCPPAPLGLLLHLPASLTALALPTLILLFAGRLLRRLR